MVSIVGVGDNVVDQYLDLGLMFPGGNALNVPVLAHRMGAKPAAYIGTLGNDTAGKHIYESLKSEGIDVSHIKVVDGSNAYAKVTLVDKDRTFVGGDKGVSDQLKLTLEDYKYLGNFDIVHSSVYSYLEDSLEEVKKASPLVSFDFSDTWDKSYLKKVLPYIDFGFFSGSGKSLEEIKDFQKEAASMGPKLILVTRGSKGAVLYYKNEYYMQSSVPVEVVDTLGAGDTFIACLIVNLLEGREVPTAMENAAKAAAKTCSYYGAFGYGTEID